MMATPTVGRAFGVALAVAPFSSNGLLGFTHIVVRSTGRVCGRDGRVCVEFLFLLVTPSIELVSLDAQLEGVALPVLRVGGNHVHVRANKGNRATINGLRHGTGNTVSASDRQCSTSTQVNKHN